MSFSPDSQAAASHSLPDARYRVVRNSLGGLVFLTRNVQAALAAKGAALAGNNHQAAEDAESAIARQCVAIAGLQENLSALLEGQEPEAYAARVSGELGADLRRLLSERKKLEWLCLKEISRLRSMAGAACARKSA